MNEGTVIRTIPLIKYPSESQELMKNIVKDFIDRKIEVQAHKGSYSIRRRYDTETAAKVLCTIGSKFETRGAGVLVLFRKELLNKIGMDNIKSDYQNIDISDDLVTVGAGVYRDFYYIKIDTTESYLSKKEDLLALAEKIISSEGSI